MAHVYTHVLTNVTDDSEFENTPTRTTRGACVTRWSARPALSN